jgi:hypothetical protein
MYKNLPDLFLKGLFYEKDFSMIYEKDVYEKILFCEKILFYEKDFSMKKFASLGENGNFLSLCVHICDFEHIQLYIYFSEYNERTN